MIYTKYTGNGSYVVLPSHHEGIPYTGIGTKAFLSHKEIEKLVLPSSITHIDDWAFAHMQQLRELVLPSNAIHFGKKVFLNCDSLRCIRIVPDHSENPGLPFFLADLAIVFSNMTLLDPVRAASKESHADWINEYDILLSTYLQEDDEAGFEPVFYGWFNDEDPDTAQRPQYIQRQRSNKVRMTFQRLQYDLHLCDTHRRQLQAYLRDHMPWACPVQKHTAVWDLLPIFYAQDIEYFHILEAAGALSPVHIPQLIAHLPQADPEVIAWPLRYQQQHQETHDFFDMFSL